MMSSRCLDQIPLADADPAAAGGAGALPNLEFLCNRPGIFCLPSAASRSLPPRAAIHPRRGDLGRVIRAATAAGFRIAIARPPDSDRRGAGDRIGFGGGGDRIRRGRGRERVGGLGARDDERRWMKGGGFC